MFKKLVGLVTVAVAGLFLNGVALAAITNSTHDLSAEIPTLTDVCSICHAPHANESAGSDGLLWNHTPSTILSYTPYASDSLEGLTAGQPGPVSTLCLSCHDGDVSVDSFGGVTGAMNITNAAFANGGPQFGAALSDDHPIGMDYDIADPELNPLNTGLFLNDAAAGTGTAGFVSDLLFGAGSLTVECASCHDVHNTDSSFGAAGEGLLRVDNANSTFCTTCHNK